MRYQLIDDIKRPSGKKEFITRFQTAGDIMKQLKRAEYNSRATSKKLATFFKSDNALTTCAKVWLFLRKEIYYNAEPNHDQTAKTINRFIVDGYGDCKHFATFAVGVLNACNIPCWFTLVGQDETVRKPNHAYATALVDKKLVVIDPCRKKFNDECKHFYKWNISPIKK